MRGSVVASRKVKARQEVLRNVAENRIKPCIKENKHELTTQCRTSREVTKTNSSDCDQTAVTYCVTTESTSKSCSRVSRLQNELTFVDGTKASNSLLSNIEKIPFTKQHRSLPKNLDLGKVSNTFSLKNNTTLYRDDSQLTDAFNSLDTSTSRSTCLRKSTKTTFETNSSSFSKISPDDTYKEQTSSVVSPCSSSSEWRLRFEIVKRRLYRKAKLLIFFGFSLNFVGLIITALYFAQVVSSITAGPILLSIGVLVMICGCIWYLIIKQELQRREAVLTRTFSI